jgi:23S rRNA pseudouridine2457 synthase
LSRYFLTYKPFGVLSQFTKEVPEHRTLADLYPFPKDVYPVGRLDKDSEGLLLLTDDKRLNQQLLDPAFAHPRTYWVQVEGIPTDQAIQQLASGVSIRINKRNHLTRPAKVQKITPSTLPDREPPVRFRKTVKDSWIELILTEGKNRQVRRMCAKVGFPVLRLIRVGIGKLKLGTMNVGEVKELKWETIKKVIE